MCAAPPRPSSRCRAAAFLGRGPLAGAFCRAPPRCSSCGPQRPAASSAKISHHASFGAERGLTLHIREGPRANPAFFAAARPAGLAPGARRVKSCCKSSCRSPRRDESPRSTDRRRQTAPTYPAPRPSPSTSSMVSTLSSTGSATLTSRCRSSTPLRAPRRGAARAGGASRRRESAAGRRRSPSWRLGRGGSPSSWRARRGGPSALWRESSSSYEARICRRAPPPSHSYAALPSSSWYEARRLSDRPGELRRWSEAIVSTRLSFG
mmetsp:Transcript_19765/g.67899  ORF Transcript_19765/g.67899 Transcript_19765/m.67899 type:complete len:265 (+) Transcript_19765:284-1078(+)